MATSVKYYPAKDTEQYEYPMAKAGLNLQTNIVAMSESECRWAQNLIWRNGMVKRAGTSKYAADEVVASSVILGVHKFIYYGGQLVLSAADTAIKYWDGAAWQVIDNTRTTGNQTFFSTWLRRAYVANGVDAPFYWTLAGGMVALGAFPTSTTMTLPYQDRLLILSNANPGDLQWTAAFDSTSVGSVANIGVRPDSQLHGMAHHSSFNVSYGQDSSVLLAGSNGMYLFKGTDLRWPSTTGNYTIQRVSNIGCVSPRTIVSTPVGTIWLGADKQVYLLAFDSGMPVPIGQKIRSTLAGVSGLESAATTYLANACATYHDGFYKLSFTSSAGTVNDSGFWLDINRLYKDENSMYGPWYGPMTGLTFSCYSSVPNTTIPDLIAGSSSGSVGGYVYKASDSTVNNDDGNSIELVYQTHYADLGNRFYRKDVHKFEMDLLYDSGSINIDYVDITGSLKTTDTVSLGGAPVYWGEQYWGDFYWNSTTPTRKRVDISPAIQPRMLSLIIKHTASADDFQFYGLRVEGLEQHVEMV